MPRNKKNQPKNQRARPIDLKKPLILLVAMAVFSALGMHILMIRPPANLVLHTTSESQILGLSHENPDEWDNSSNPISGITASGDIAGYMHLSPQEGSEYFHVSLQTPLAAVTTLNHSSDSETLNTIETFPVDTSQMSSIEISARSLKFALGFDSQLVNVALQGSSYGFLFHPAGLYKSTQMTVIGQGVTDSSIEEWPIIVFLTRNGNSLFQITGMSEKDTLLEVSDAIQVKINGISAKNSADVTDIKLSVTDALPFRMLVLQGDFGIANVVLDKTSQLDFDIALPYYFVRPPSGSIVIGSQPENSLIPAQNELEIHAPDSDTPVTLHLELGASQSVQPTISGESNYVLLNKSRQLVPSLWDNLGDEVRSGLVTTLFGAIGFISYQFYRSFRPEERDNR